MPQNANPWAAVDDVLGSASVAEEQQTARNLVAFADQNHYRITDGYRAGKGHSPNSMHYQGDAHDPGAIDIDHRGVDLAKLQTLAAAQGYTVLDEVNHPSRWSTGPHYHIQKQRGGPPQGQRDMLKPTASVSVAPNKPVDLHLPLTQDSHGNILTRNQAPGVTGSEIEQYVQSNTPSPVKLDVSAPVDKSNPWATMDSIIADAGKVQPEPAAPAAPPNPFDQFGAGFQNAITGFTNDEQARQAQGFWGGAGNILGTLGFAGGAGLGGAALGSIVPGAGTAGGFGAGLLAGGTAAGALQEDQRQRLAGQPRDLLKDAGAGLIGGLTSLPTGGVASTLGKTILKNAAIDAGINTAGDIGLQMVEQGSIDPRQVDLGRAAQAAVIGAGTGGLSGLAHAKSGGLAPKQVGAVDMTAPIHETIPQFNTQADVIRNIADLERQSKARDILSVLDEPIVAAEGMEGHLPKNGFVDRKGQVIGKFKGEASPVNLMPKTEMLNKPEAVEGLSDGFQQRVYDANGQPQIIDPRNATMPEGLGPLKTETLESGLTIATKEARKREILPIEIERGGVPARGGVENLSEAEKEAIGTYAQTGYAATNKLLREGTTPKYLPPAFENSDGVRQATDLLNSAATKFKTQQPVTLYRGVDYPINLKVGDIYSDSGFMSTSIDPEIAIQHSRPATGKNRAVFKIELPEGSAHIPVSDLVGSKEGEYLLPPNMKYRVKEINTNDVSGLNVYKLEPDVNTLKPENLALSGKENMLGLSPRPSIAIDLLDTQGRPIREKSPKKGLSRDFGGLEIPGRAKPTGSLELLRPMEAPPTRDLLEPVQPGKTVETAEPSGGVYRTPEGGEVYTHGRDPAEIQQQLAASQGQIANIADIERHLQTHNPDAVPAIRNILDAGKNSEAVKFSYVAREAPGEPARARDNFIPTHFTYETISPSTQRSFLRRKYGSDEEVISHLKQEIVNGGGSVDASMLQTKSGRDIKPATQVGRLINTLDKQTGGAYLKSPRVHGINLGETTRSAAGGRGIRLDTITDSSLTGRKVKPEELAGHTYDNQIAPALKALNDMAGSSSSPLFKRVVTQIQTGKISRQTVRELRSALADNKVAAQFCSSLGIKL